MKILFFIFSLIISLGVSGQLSEVKEQQERMILFNHVKSLKVYIFDYQNKSIDSTLSILEKYNPKGQLIEKRTFNGQDTSNYRVILYTRDTFNNSLLITNTITQPSTFNCYSYVGHPKKRIEKANDKQQLISVKEYLKNGDVMNCKYTYGSNDLLERIDFYINKKLFWVYQIHYEYY